MSASDDRQEPHPKQRGDIPSADSALAGKTVVLVEDEGLVQMQLRRLLPVYGATIVGAARSGP